MVPQHTTHSVSRREGTPKLDEVEVWILDIPRRVHPVHSRCSPLHWFSSTGHFITFI